MRGRQARGEKCFISKEEAQEGNMRAEGQGRVKNDLWDGERISERSALTRLLSIMRAEGQGEREESRVHLLRAKELLCELICELDQDVVRATVGVPE
jgi:hypothetical protein